MPILDIIVPHYQEPWEVGSKFFQMLDLQRGINFDDIHVIVVQDGEEGTLPDEHFQNRPYTVDYLTIPHGGVSVARNAGLDFARSEWVMFCDFDDTFANVYALRDILNVLPAPGYDMLYMDFVAEDRMKDGSMHYNPRTQNVVFIHGKLWRRQWLISHHLNFDESLTFNEDSAFCTIANTMMDFSHTGKITTSAPAYVWCFSENSTTTTPGNRGKLLVGLYDRNKKVCEIFRQRMPFRQYVAMIARTVWDTYHALNVEDLTPELEAMLEDFKGWYKGHKALYLMADEESMRETGEISRAEHTRGDQEEEERWGIEHVSKFRENVSLEEWLKGVE